ncbi:NADH dehydrogenase [ubiquinone] iron-sulfur protein 6, mitochondrial isoform 5 precursor [Mus musculus]|uniref:NADH dehydrogenase [ubiquinone] iron-sulfur protein 6, mitochondrial isoform 5 precursor n=1 Tax=Mus musculus TaxID=10090 RepID=UPI00272EB8C6|nr:NADH dehydrogenase [ubiquinone] iron-sulfur protein 6, mitochondrial isoform 5 precursor [Mus musculus]
MAAVLTFRRLLTLPRAARGFGVQVSPSGEKITHTGQVYDEKDYRRVRFVDRQKEDKETKTGTCGYCGLQFKQHHH